MRRMSGAILAALLLAGAAQASGWASPAEAVELVNKGVAYLKANGKDKALAEFNNPNGPFVHRDRDLYIFVLDGNGRTLANGVNARLVGKDVLEMRDVDGKHFIRDILTQAASKGSGWVDYKWSNQATNAIEPKSTYFTQVGDVIVAAGIYK
jgi:signal transduction histidine kinase